MNQRIVHRVIVFAALLLAGAVEAAGQFVEQTPRLTVDLSFTDWAAPSGHSTTDWVGLYAAGDAETSFLSFQYISSETSGTMTFAAPAPAGSYELRLFTNDGFTRVATSNPVTVTAGNGYILTATQSTVNAGDPLDVSWTAPGGRPSTDWVALYRVGDPNTAYMWWQYTNGAASGAVTIGAPGDAGQYEFRYLQEDGFIDVARSTAVTVQ
jgi:hypothetical protein